MEKSDWWAGEKQKEEELVYKIAMEGGKEGWRIQKRKRDEGKWERSGLHQSIC